jgi:AhpD family alkylhydroperoxidase
MHRANVPVPAVIIRDTEASMSDIVQQFNDYRSRMNERVLETDNKVIKRFFNLDTNAYLDGARPGRTKEMMGLVASMVLRCDDCIRYHVQQCHEAGVTRVEFFEIFSVGLVVGGSIVVPHLRRAVEFLDILEATP